MLTMDMTQVKAIMVLSGVPHEIGGWSDASDCLSFPDAVELNMIKKGATGSMLASGTGEKGGEVSIKVLANSPFVDRMAAEAELIKQGIQVPIQFTMTNNTIGDNVVCTNGSVKTVPAAPTYGKGEVAEMVYVFEFEKIVYAPIASKRGQVTSTLTGGLIG